MDVEEKKFREELFDLGTGIVKQRVETGSYNERRLGWARTWLNEQEAERTARVNADNERGIALGYWNLWVAILALCASVIAAIASIIALSKSP